MKLIAVFSWAAGAAWAEAPSSAPAEDAQDDAAEGDAAEEDPAEDPAAEDPAAEDDAAEDPAEEVVVTGTRSQRRLGDSPVAVEVIGREQIDAAGATDLSQVLESHPGIDVQRDQFGSTVRLRGLDANQVLILVDGQRLVGTTGGATNLGRIPVDDIERIEIVKGPSSALYGSDALGGVIQIVTRAPQRPSASVDLRGGAMVADTLPTADLTGSATVGKGKLAGRATVGFHSRPMFDRDPSDPRTTTSGRDEWLLGGRVDLRPDPDLTIPVQGQYTLTTLRGVDQNGLAVLDRDNATQDARILVQPSLTGERSRTSLHVGLSGFRDQFLYDQRGGTDLDQFQETTELLLQVSPQRDQIAGPHTFTIGGDLFAARIRSERLDAGGGSRVTGAAFVQDEWRIARQPLFAVVPGFRYDVDSWFGASPNPRLAVRLDPLEPLTVRSSVGTGFRAPTFRELLLTFDNPGVGYRVVGNPELRPERSVTVDGAVEWDPVDAFGASVSAWWTELDDLLNFVVVSDDGAGTLLYSYENVAQARSRGVEGTVALRPGEARFDVSYTFTDARDLTLDRPLSGRQRHRATVDLGGRVVATGTEPTLRAAFVGPAVVYDDDNVVVAGTGTAEGTPVPGYVLLDLRVEQRLTRDLRLYGGVDNLLDAGDANLVLLTPRLVYAGLTAAAAAGPKRSEGR